MLASAVLGTLLVVLAACGPAGPAEQLPPAPPTAAPTLAPIRFPEDEAPHDSLTEWWYYTGHLRSADGRRYGFEQVFFRFNRGGEVLLLGQLAVTDHERRSFRFAERADRVAGASPDERFDLRIADWAMRGRLGEDHLEASMDGYALTLDLEPLKPPVLHNDVGLISLGPAGDSYYYSRTRLGAAGTLVDHGEPLRVEGLAWHDHQWGDFIVDPTGGWDWFSVQLDDESELMLYPVRSASGRQAAYGTYVAPDGSARSLQPADAQVEATGRWTSPASGATYPQGWTIRLADPPTELRLTAVLADQELRFETVTYWEGEVEVAGVRAGRPIAGLGYVELTGYARPARR